MKWACVVSSKSNACGEMAHVPLVPPKELSLSPPTRFVLREEGQKFISIPSQIKFSLTQPGLGLRAQSGIKIKKYHKKLKQSQIKTNLKARTHRDEYRRALFASLFQCVFCVHTQVIFADDEPSEHANSFPDIRWRLM